MKKVMLCIWDIKGVVYELLLENQTIDAAKYCEQLDCLREAVQQKRPEANRRGVTFHHDNARPHTHLCAPVKNYSNFLEMFCRTRCIVLSLLHQIIISFALFKILLMKKFSQIRMLLKFTLSGFSRKNLRHFRKRRFLIYSIIKLK